MLELNFIWVGSAGMPAEQLRNFTQIRRDNPDAVIQIWAMPDILNSELCDFCKENNIAIKSVYDLLEPQQYPYTAELLDLLKNTTLWSSMGDILKFLILSRPSNPGEPQQRAYLEADNKYSANLQDVFHGRGFVYQCADAKKKFWPRADSFYIDLQTPVGKLLQENMKPYLETFLADSTINRILKVVIAKNKPMGFSFEDVVIETFGSIPTYVCRGLIRLFPPKQRSEFAELNFGQQQFGSRSWHDNAKQMHKDKLVSVIRWEAGKETLKAARAMRVRRYIVDHNPMFWPTNLKTFISKRLLGF